MEFLNKIEQEIILLFRKEFEGLSNLILENEEFFHSAGMFRIQNVENPNLPSQSSYLATIDDSLSKAIVRQFIDKKEVILLDVDQSNISQEEKLFLTYYINYLNYQFDVCNYEKQSKAIKSAQNLAKNYPSSDYLVIPKRYTSKDKKKKELFIYFCRHWVQ